MLHFNRDKLVHLNYWFIGLLLIGTVAIIMFTKSPERIILGEWEEVGWQFEKPDASLSRDRFDDFLHENVRANIMDKMNVMHVDTWRFDNGGELRMQPDPNQDLGWSIKGSGHILEVKKDGRTLESFQIHRLNKDYMELHLMLDIQLKGIVKIVLKRKDFVEEEEYYAKEI